MEGAGSQVTPLSREFIDECGMIQWQASRRFTVTIADSEQPDLLILQIDSTNL